MEPCKITLLRESVSCEPGVRFGLAARADARCFGQPDASYAAISGLLHPPGFLGSVGSGESSQFNCW